MIDRELIYQWDNGQRGDPSKFAYIALYHSADGHFFLYTSAGRHSELGEVHTTVWIEPEAALRFLQSHGQDEIIQSIPCLASLSI